MTYVTVRPTNADAEARLTGEADVVMDALFSATRDTFPIPDDDILVELLRCSTVAFRPSSAAPDVVVAFTTSDLDLQPLFPALTDRIVTDWTRMLPDLKVEIWISLIDAWATNIEV